MRRAVIDLGSNTFHLLIADDIEGSSFREVYRKRKFVGLSEVGLSTISENAITRGIDALKEFYIALQEHRVSTAKIIGTSSLRSADNAPDVRKKFETIIGQHIDIIDGDLEADYIHQGTALLTARESAFRTYAVIDIGGGSTECIVVLDGKPIFTHSYKLGVGVLYNRRKYADPMLNNEVYELQHYIQNTMADFFRIARKHDITTLVGSSGSMEVLAKMDVGQIDKHKLTPITMPSFTTIYHKIIDSTQESLAYNQYITPQRAKLISVGMVLLKCVVDEMNIQSIYFSPYALKEGVLSSL